MKHWDFIVLDFLCLQLSLVIGYWIVAGFGNPYGDAGARYFAALLAVCQLAMMPFAGNYFAIVRRNTLGHKAGDQYICEHFKHSPVFRIGGDEFAVVMEGADSQSREELVEAFNRQIEENLRAGSAVVSAGIAVYDPAKDANAHSVFSRRASHCNAARHSIVQSNRNICWRTKL